MGKGVQGRRYGPRSEYCITGAQRDFAQNKINMVSR